MLLALDWRSGRFHMRTNAVIGRLVALGIALSLVCPVASQAGKGDVKAKGKQVYAWSLDEGKGLEVKESGGKGPVGKITGDIQWTDGVSGKALQFSGGVGRAQYVAFAGDDHLDITDSLTMAAWLWLEALPQGDQANKGTIFFKNTYYMQVEPVSGSLAYYFYDTNNPGYHLSSKAVTANKEWQFAAITWDGTVALFYLNAEKDPTEIKQSGPGRSTPDKAVFVGGENNACCPRFFQGKIDNITLANYALSRSELQSLMTTALSVEPHGKLATRWAGLKNVP